MSSRDGSTRIEVARSRLLEETTLAQRRASDPRASAWVSANAGAGKTHVLKMRVLRLLLAGAEPSRILCLTYTNAAAAEMSQRVFDELASWAVCSQMKLETTLHELLGRSPEASQLTRARQLFASVVESPGGLTIKTIHGFCERLLQRFPLEAGLAPDFETLDEQSSAALRANALTATLLKATNGKDGSLRTALETAIAYASDDRFADVIASTLDQRTSAALELIRALMAAGAAQDRQDLLDLYLRAQFGLPADATAEGITQQIADVLSADDLRYAVQVLGAGKPTDAETAGELERALLCRTPAERAQAVISAFLTKTGEARKRFITKAIQQAEPQLTDRLCRARDVVAAAAQHQRVLRGIAATCAMLKIADGVHQAYADLKVQTAALDFDDLVDRTAQLLCTSADAQWVLFKLDGGLDHILVDEAQDTSTRQWQIVQSLGCEFYESGVDRPGPRTLFGVGDEKQSIYSFQGAEPRLFNEAGLRFEELAKSGGARFERIPLTLSFRTTEPILEAVDCVFAEPARTPGVGRPETSVRHSALRLGHAGSVELWPLEEHEDTGAAPIFDPLSEQTPTSPAVRLARRIAAQIRWWLDNGTMLEANARPIRAGDIMILLRKRRPLGPLLLAEFKQQRIPVAGADRLALADHIAVQDLLAVADFVTLPEDDLALACLLKSPLFDFNDSDLTLIAPERRGSLWSALIQHARTDSRFQVAADTLKKWRAGADRSPPYEFFATLLDSPAPHLPGLTFRQAILRRLGPDAIDPLDELLERALAYDDIATPSLQGFAHWMRTATFEIKRDMEHGGDQVRIMTVHGAKGLEANIVFLPDTTADPGQSRQGPFVDLMDARRADKDRQSEPVTPALFWPVGGTGGIEIVRSAKDRRTRLEIEESNRLLYVAMTRARDRLYIGGVAPKNGSVPDNSWYRLVSDALSGVLRPGEDAFGRPVMRMASKQLAEPEPDKDKVAVGVTPAPLPDWALRRAPLEPERVIPIVPSRLAPLETDEIGDPLERSPQPAGAFEGGMQSVSHPGRSILADGPRFLRGTLTHALLQQLPAAPAHERSARAARFLQIRAPQIDEPSRREIAAEAIAVLSDPAFHHAFGPNSRAEVPLVAEIPHPRGSTPLRISGQIDRLVELDDEVLIIDFKANRLAPRSPDAVPDAYVLQLAAYRMAIRQVFQGKATRMALLWTAVPCLTEVDGAQLDAAEWRLWS